MEPQNHYIPKEATNTIKGIALILMFIHHFFTFPEWYINGVSYPYLTELCHLTKICVPIFAFLTGYCYYFCETKTLKYSIKKSTDVWLTYIVCFLLLLIPNVCLGVYSFSVKGFVLELFAVQRPTMVFCWYVIFYFFAILLLPLYAKKSERSPIVCFLVTLSIPTLILFFLDLIFPESTKGITQIKGIIENLNWFPCIGIGFLFAKYGLFYQFQHIIKPNKKLSFLCGFACIGFAILSRYLKCLDYVSVPFFIFGIIEIYNNTKHKYIYVPFSIIGKYSLIMWFIHCVFFNQGKEYTQPLLYFLKNPLLVTIWGLVVCLIAAVIIQLPINILLKIKNRLFDY